MIVNNNQDLEKVIKVIRVFYDNSQETKSGVTYISDDSSPHTKDYGHKDLINKDYEVKE